MARLSLQLFGAFRATLDGAVLSGFDSDKTRALFVYLAVESDRAHRRETLAGLFWPDVLESSARQSLSQALTNLRRLLRDSAGSPKHLAATRESIQFLRDGECALDIDWLTAANGNAGQAPTDVLALYPAPFLEGFSLPGAEGFEEWVVLQRESLQRRALGVFDAATAAALERGAASDAITLAERQLILDPWRETAHRQLMHALALAGQRGDALQQYEKCKSGTQR